MSAAHTPGPWKSNAHTSEHTITGVAIEAGNRIVAIVPAGEDVSPIAAAPDLLHALRWCLLDLEADGTQDVEWIRAVIAKAEGRS
jgi:hypothetical protein